MPGPGALGRPAPDGLVEVHGTTVIALKYRGGILNLGDRRATAANAIMFDRAEKLMALDDYTLIAVSGSYAKAIEVIKYLRHSFSYYRRSQLQEMSLEGKVTEVSRVIAGNVAAAMQGIGAFIPVVSALDPESGEGRIFFYDGLGARFETAEFGAAGSGSMQIRGIFDYILRSKGPFREMAMEDALAEALTLLEIASDLDSATGGSRKILPAAKTISREGIQDLPEELVRRVLQERVPGNV